MTITIGIVTRRRQLRQSGPIFSFTQFTFDPATLAWVAAVIAAGGTVSNARETLVDNLITGLKSDGVWTKLDRLWIHAMENQTEALIDLVADASATAVNSPTFTTDRGFTGDGSTSYLDSGFKGSSGPNYTTNSACIGSWDVSARSSGGNKCSMGVQDASSNTAYILPYTFGNTQVIVNDGNLNPTVTDSSGLWVGSRTANNLQTLYHNGSSIATDTATITHVAPVIDWFIGSLNSNGTASNFSADQLACTLMGGGLSSTDSTNLYNRLRTYMTAVGVP